MKPLTVWQMVKIYVIVTGFLLGLAFASWNKAHAAPDCSRFYEKAVYWAERTDADLKVPTGFTIGVASVQSLLSMAYSDIFKNCWGR